MQLLPNTILISKRAAVLIATAVFAACVSDPHDPNALNRRMGDLYLAVTDSTGEISTAILTGIIDSSDMNDTTFIVPGVGTFDHHIVFKDTTSNLFLRVYYTLPFDARIRLDPRLIELRYKKVGSRSALLLKNKTDSLVCLFGNLLPDDLQPLLDAAGAQNIKILRGVESVNIRVNDCGREGDFNTLFDIGPNHVSLYPAQHAIVQDYDRTYTVVNNANTYLVKNLKGCPETVAEFSYAIIQIY